jgi:hypothetical protein
VSIFPLIGQIGSNFGKLIVNSRKFSLDLVLETVKLGLVLFDFSLQVLGASVGHVESGVPGMESGSTKKNG